MRRSNHIIIGVGTAFLAYPLVTITQNTINLPVYGSVLLGSYLGSCFPDLDYPKRLAVIDDNILTPEQRNRKYNHRDFGVLHTLIIPVILSVLTLPLFFYSLFNGFLILKLLTAFLIGVVSGHLLHLFADMFTPKGIRICYPFSNIKISLTKVKFFYFLSRHQFLWILLYFSPLLIIHIILFVLSNISN